MQRQSLGGGSSPGSKHHHHHNINGVSSSSSSSKEVFNEEEEEEEERGVVLVSEIEEEEKLVEKKKRHRSHHHHHLRSRTEKSIHLIPILTIFCLLILYLCSYDPPLKDLAHIDGFRKISKKRIDSTTTTEINNGLERFSSELDDDDDQNNKGVVGDVLLSIRSHRSLHEIRRKDYGKKSHRFHRKIGDYYYSHIPVM